MVHGAGNGVTTIGSLVLVLNGLMHQFITKNNITGTSAYEVVALDGGEQWDSPEGIINFYSEDIPTEETTKCLSFLKYQIGEYNSELLNRPYVETSGMYGKDVWRLRVKIDVTPSEVQPEVNITNTSAQVILQDVLNYPPDEDTFSAKELLMKIEQLEDNDLPIFGGTTDDKIDKNLYTQGMSEDRIRQTLDRLKRLCEWAISNDYSMITTS